MLSVGSQLIEEVPAHVHSDSLEDAQEICANGAYFSNNQRIKSTFVFAVQFYNYSELTKYNHKYVQSLFTQLPCHCCAPLEKERNRSVSSVADIIVDL